MKFTNNTGAIAYSNEHNSREIYFSIEDDLQDCDIYIDFSLPNGNKYKTARLNDLEKYLLPNSLLGNSGLLKAQLVAYRGDTFIQKSKMAYFYIGESINATQDIVADQPDAIEELQTGKGDGLSYSNNHLQLTANGNPIGDAVEIEAGSIKDITGTNDNPIYLKDLQTGNYIVTGLYTPYQDSGISSWGDKQLIEVYRSEDKVDVYLIDVLNSIIETFEVNIDGSNYIRQVVTIGEITLNKRVVDDAMNIFYSLLEDQSKVENSVAQTRMINISFPDDMVAGYRSKVVFKTGATIPSLTINGVVKLLGDGVSNNQLVLQPNKIYTINFEKDVFDLVGRVEARD